MSEIPTDGEAARPVPSLAQLSERRARELAQQAEDRAGRARKLEALAILDPLTAAQAVHPPDNCDVEAMQRGDQRAVARDCYREIPPYSAEPSLPVEYLDALVGRITEVRAALQDAYLSEPLPQLDLPRLPKPTPEDVARWGHALRWLLDADLDVVRVEAAELAASHAGRDELRELASVLLHRIVWHAAQTLCSHIPPRSQAPPTPEQWAEQKRKEEEWVETLRRQATATITTHSIALPPMDPTPPIPETTSPPRPTSPFATLLQEEEERKKRAAAEARRAARMRRFNEFRAAWADAWSRFLIGIETQSDQFAPAARALAEIGRLLNRLPRARLDLRDSRRTAAARLQAMCNDGRWRRPRGLRTAATLLLEATRGESEPELAQMLRTTAAVPDLVDAFHWMAFYRDRFLSQPGVEHPSGFLIGYEAMPSTDAHVDDIRLVAQ